MLTILSSEIFWQFTILNFIVVLVGTLRSLITIKGGKWSASIANAIYFGYNTIIIFITATYEIPLSLKVTAVAVVNLVGVFAIKLGEEKLRKDKFWIYKTIGVDRLTVTQMSRYFKACNIKCTVTEVEKDFNILEVYCKTQKDSLLVKKELKDFHLKFYAIEAKENN